MSGLYNTPLMDENKTNGHWKREQDNYLSNIGAMSLIKRDPMASLGYQIRSENPYRTLEMGSGVDPVIDGMHGLYQFRPKGGSDTGPRYDGTLDVAVGNSPEGYAQTVAHELGHVGSRNSQTDEQLISNASEEERRQRITDLANGGDVSTMGWEARNYLMAEYGMTVAQIDTEVGERRKELGIKGDPSIWNPSKEAKARIKAQRKKKVPLKPSIDPEYANAPSWMPEQGID
ncbi:hypothetical protein UFOVP1087_38 [uncultured Caudovirales phage]|uniref:Uncharacterized protein n=1 Tax=uncultured Caudovirales phage TaxID=2100421 RepID=A0A6J5QHD9_9CAUD|nr:hypothetical protein UFOVP910_8 [uncultured Caudovirales phage]CAB4183072.1 hypothetical protein UFOVP1087_38 [uncultured Caudovirales phage]CAB5228186.1 hypothetical protein UFOVP1534_7 [uncultured Caudovirales phage]